MKKQPKVRLNEPTLFDLIDRCFPEPYRTRYLNPLNICKTLQAACRVEMKESCLGVNPAGSESYFDRCAVHQMVSDLQKQHPDWINQDYVRHIQSVKVNGRYLPFEYRTIKDWVSEIIPTRRGRPPGRENTH
jgi:hypothetical protein